MPYSLNFSLMTVTSIVCSLIIVTQGRYYHISPSANDSCSSEVNTCLTLAQFTANLDTYLTWSTTLLFLPGDHSLESDFSVTESDNLDSLYLQLNSKFAKIHCDLFASFDFENVSMVYVHGIEFLECSFFLSSVDRVIIKDTAFTGQAAFGNTLELHECYTVIIGSYFTSATGINAISSNLTVIQTLVEGSSEEALSAKRNSKIVIVNSSFVNNAMKCNPCNIMQLSESHAIVNGSRFENNSAVEDGGIFLVRVSVISIYNSSFMLNTAGIFNTYLTNLNIHVSEFISNKANNGGIIVAMASYIFIIESTFIDNNATDEGGVLYATESSIVVTERNFFGNNVATKCGGVMSVLHSNVTTFGDEVINNGATNGGVISICLLQF